MEFNLDWMNKRSKFGTKDCKKYIRGYLAQYIVKKISSTKLKFFKIFVIFLPYKIYWIIEILKNNLNSPLQ